MFANVGYEFSDRARLDVSLRYDHDKRENTTLTPTAFLPNVPGFPARTGQVRDAHLRRLAAQDHPDLDAGRRLTLYGG